MNIRRLSVSKAEKWKWNGKYPVLMRWRENGPVAIFKSREEGYCLIGGDESWRVMDSGTWNCEERGWKAVPPHEALVLMNEE